MNIRLITVFSLILAMGCETKPLSRHQPPAQIRTYNELVTQHNHNLRLVKQLWSRAVIELSWQDENGQHLEQGDGNLIIVLPDRLAMSLGKLGKTLMWAGCHAQHYWFFDLRDDRIVYTGSYTASQHTDSRSLPLPVQPNDLIHLLGITPIPLVPEAQQPPVRWQNNAFLVEPPGYPQRSWLDPKTARCIQIDLTDSSGQISLTSKLSRWQRMTITGAPPGAYPWIPTKIEITLPADQSTITMFLSDANDGQTHNRIQSRAFDLNHLLKVFKPNRQIDLNNFPTEP